MVVYASEVQMYMLVKYTFWCGTDQKLKKESRSVPQMNALVAEKGRNRKRYGPESEEENLVRTFSAFMFLWRSHADGKVRTGSQRRKSSPYF